VPIVIGLFKMAAWAVVFAVASAGPDIAVSLAGVVEAALAVSVVLVPTLISEVSMPTVRVMFVAVMAGGKQGWTMDADRGDAASPQHFQTKPIAVTTTISDQFMALLNHNGAASAAQRFCNSGNI
jgi:hypothetical protein